MIFLILLAVGSVLCASDSERWDTSSLESGYDTFGEQSKLVSPLPWSILPTNTFPYIHSERFAVGGSSTSVCYGQNAVNEEGILVVTKGHEYMTITVEKNSVAMLYYHAKTSACNSDHFQADWANMPEGDPDVLCRLSCDEEGITIRRFVHVSEGALCGHFLGAKVTYKALNQCTFLQGVAGYTDDVHSERVMPEVAQQT